jgi:hypothetical protein
MDDPMNAVTFVWPRDLHLTEAGHANHIVATNILDGITMWRTASALCLIPPSAIPPCRPSIRSLTARNFAEQYG